MNEILKKAEKINNIDNLQIALAKASQTIADKNAEIKRLNSEIAAKDIENDKKIKELEKELKKLKTSKTFFSDIKDKEDKQRLILMLRARQYSIQLIKDYIDNNCIDGIDEELIDYTVNNIKTLSPELESYYNEQKDIFNTKIKVNGEEVKEIVNNILVENLDTINKLIKEETDVSMLKQLINEKNNIAGKFSSLLGNIVEEEKEAPVVNLEIQNMQKEMKDKNEKLMKFGTGNVRVV